MRKSYLIAETNGVHGDKCVPDRIDHSLKLALTVLLLEEKRYDRKA